MIRKWEIVVLVGAVLGTVKVFYELRHVPWIGSSLSVIVALVLIYPAYWHAESRKLGIRFFEPDLKSVGTSVKWFAVLAVTIFPLFFLGNHFYQTTLLQAEFRPRPLNLGWAAVLTQIFLIALSEEFFFRGYLQTLVSRRMGKTFRFLGVPALTMSRAVPLASLIFALAHTFITFRWWHFAIFFPGLAFGWLREKTNGLVAPVLFHATSNVVMNVIGQLYR